MMGIWHMFIDRKAPIHGCCQGCDKPVRFDQSHTTAASGNPRRPEHWHTECWNQMREELQEAQREPGKR